MTNEFYIYGHYDLNLTLRYIGKGKERRAWNFRRKGGLWSKVFKTNKPSVVILEDNLSEKDAWLREKHYIKFYRERGMSANAHLINVCDGGKGGISGKNHPLYGVPVSKERIEKSERTKRERGSHARYWYGKQRDPDLMRRLKEAGHTPEARKKRRIAMTGRTLSDEHKKAIGTAIKGRKLTDEHKQAISEAKKGRPNGLEGRVMPEEHRRKIAEASKGRKMSSAAIEKRRQTLLGRPSPKRKQVLCINTGKIYAHAIEAAAELNVCHKKIQSVCTGKRLTTGGYKFKYA